MAKKTRTELSTLAINTNLPDNTTELITPTTERAQLTDERESVVNYKDDFGGTGNSGKFLTVATDGESLTMVDAPTGDITGTGSAARIAFWSAAKVLTYDDYLSWNTSTDTLNAFIVNATSKLIAAIINSPEGNSITLSTQPTGGALTPRLTISDGGNVGIGGTLANKKLYVLGDTTNYQILAEQPSGYAGLSIKSTTIAETWSFIASDNSGNSDLLLYGGAAASTKLTLSSGGDATFSGNITVTRAINLTNSNIAPTGGGIYQGSNTIQIRSGTSGFTVNNNANTIVNFKVADSGTIFINNLGGYASANADVRFDTSSKELYYQTSSIRYKKDVVNLDNSLSKITSLRAVRFKDKNTNKNACGLIAEETFKIIPEVVFTKKIEGFDDPQVEGINYSDIVPFLIKGMQEQQTIIEDLKARIEKLEL